MGEMKTIDKDVATTIYIKIGSFFHEKRSNLQVFVEYGEQQRRVMIRVWRVQRR